MARKRVVKACVDVNQVINKFIWALDEQPRLIQIKPDDTSGTYNNVFIVPKGVKVFMELKKQNVKNEKIKGN